MKKLLLLICFLALFQASGQSVELDTNEYTLIKLVVPDREKIFQNTIDVSLRFDSTMHKLLSSHYADYNRDVVETQLKDFRSVVLNKNQLGKRKLKRKFKGELYFLAGLKRKFGMYYVGRPIFLNKDKSIVVIYNEYWSKSKFQVTSDGHSGWTIFILNEGEWIFDTAIPGFIT